MAATGGTEVKTIGDSVMVSYKGAADALAGGVAMQRAVERHNRGVEDHRLEMRVGISAGDASFEDGDWFGTPVVEASRLCADAAGGQILVSDLVRALAGSRCEFDVRPLGHARAEGSSRAARGVRGRLAPAARPHAAFRCPRSSTPRRGSPFAGRTRGVRDAADRVEGNARGRAPRGAGFGRARHRQDAPRQRAGAARARTRHVGVVGPLRRGAQRAVRAVRRGAASLRGVRARRPTPRRARPARRRAHAHPARPRARVSRARGAGARPIPTPNGTACSKP